MPFTFEFCIFLLQLGRIQKHNLSYLSGGSSAVDFAMEALANQLGQQTTVVKVRMSQENSVQGMGLNEERLPVSVSKVSFLVKPAVHQKPDVVSFQ